MSTKLEALTQLLNADPALSDALSEYIREHAAERDALRAEAERLRRESVPMCVPTADGFRRVGGRRLLRAAQSLHRAWKRERDLVDRYQRDHDDWMWTTDKCDCAICDEVRDRKSLRSDARDGIVTRLRAFVRQLRADGLDIDDPDTAPTWTGKIHANGRLVFDLATVGDPSGSALLDKLREVTAGLHASTGIPYSALCHYQDRPHCAGCPDDATCEASGREPRGTP